MREESTPAAQAGGGGGSSAGGGSPAGRQHQGPSYQCPHGMRVGARATHSLHEGQHMPTAAGSAHLAPQVSGKPVVPRPGSTAVAPVLNRAPPSEMGMPYSLVARAGAGCRLAGWVAGGGGVCTAPAGSSTNQPIARPGVPQLRHLPCLPDGNQPAMNTMLSCCAVGMCLCCATPNIDSARSTQGAPGGS